MEYLGPDFFRTASGAHRQKSTFKRIGTGPKRTYRQKQSTTRWVIRLANGYAVNDVLDERSCTHRKPTRDPFWKTSDPWRLRSCEAHGKGRAHAPSAYCLEERCRPLASQSGPLSALRPHRDVPSRCLR